ncbi:MAG: glycosyltransferase, partial [Actinomycetota bacterium]|nr:glycosyltransferase [Actinomycetota bacterium]
RSSCPGGVRCEGDLPPSRHHGRQRRRLVTRRLLVVTTVHPAEDPRIREKHIRTLSSEFDVIFATKAPPPTDRTGLDWRILSGGRVARWLAALKLMLTTRADAIAIHDPELILAAVTTRLIRGIPIVFDLHENFPAQILTKASVPRMLRRPLAGMARFWLSAAERSLAVSLAEDGYRSLFCWEHPVFPNYPDMAFLPEPDQDQRTGVVYVGDVTEQRGALTLLDAAASAGVGPVVYVGRCGDALRQRLVKRADASGVEIEILGWRSHAEAMTIAGHALVGVSPLHDTPNYRNSLPTKTLEYLAMGTPVIASDLPGTSSIVGSLPGVRLVPAGDTEALARALESIDNALVEEAVEGAADVRSRFQWPTDEVRAFYASLLDG